MKEGEQFVVISGSGDVVWHAFKEGDTVTFLRYHHENDKAVFAGKSRTSGDDITQILYCDMVKSVSEEESSQKREKCVYSVEDDKYQYTLTRDREYARKIKADLGGKKAGVVIIRYVATNEIR